MSGYTKRQWANNNIGAPYGPINASRLNGLETAVEELKTLTFNVRDYGAVGDGVANDTTAIQAALDACNSAAGGVVFLPRGTHKVNATLLVYSNTILRGAGWGSVIKGIAGANPIIKGTDPVHGLVDGCGIEDLTIDGTSPATGLVGIYWTRYLAGSPVTAGRNNWIKGCQVKNCQTGIRCVWDQGLAMYSTYVQSNDYGLVAADNSQLGVCVQCDFRWNNIEGVRLESTAPIVGGTPDRIYGWHFLRCHWENNYGRGLVLDGAMSNTFDTCKWEGNDNDFILLTDAISGLRPDGNVFINGMWNGDPSTPTVLQVNLLRGANNQFIGGRFNGSNTNGILINASAIDTMFIGTTIADPAKLVDNSTSSWYLDPDKIRVSLDGQVKAKGLKCGPDVTVDPLPSVLSGVKASSDAIVFAIKGFSGQTANLIEGRDSSDVKLFQVAADGTVKSTLSGYDHGTLQLQYGRLYLNDTNLANFSPSTIDLALGVSPRSVGTPGIVVRALGSQTADLTRWESSTPATLTRINKAGYFITAKKAAPADGDLNASEMALWLDDTNGAGKLMVKAKTANGTVVTGSLTLT
jgi:hypothetical protein